MWCSCYPQPLVPCKSIIVLKQTENLRRKENFFFLSSSSSPSSLGKHQWQTSNYPKTGNRLKCKVSVVPPSESGDITSFLLISGAMISMYLVANFVVPSLLFKSLQVEEEEDSD